MELWMEFLDRIKAEKSREFIINPKGTSPGYFVGEGVGAPPMILRDSIIDKRLCAMVANCIANIAEKSSSNRLPDLSEYPTMKEIIENPFNSLCTVKSKIEMFYSRSSNLFRMANRCYLKYEKTAGWK